MKQHLKAISVKKPEKGNMMCEDACKATGRYIAVSDGAGGGGVFADRWAQHLISQVPEEPITSYEELSGWMEKIWNPFYEEHEVLAKNVGGIFLNKFYDEGSFATLVAAWCEAGKRVRWMAYGDSVVFHYDKTTGVLAHSFGDLSDFSQQPCLLNWKDEQEPEGFSSGVFNLEHPSYVFACSDALAHYVMMMYAVAQGQEFANLEGKSVNLMKVAKLRKVNFLKDVLKPLFRSLTGNTLADYCESLHRKGLLALDDYSLARLK